MIITIDGPAGSGKSTVARKLANKLAFVHLNSGALFRAVGLKAQTLGIATDDDEALVLMARATSFRFQLRESSEDGVRETVLFVDDAEPGAKLFTAEAGRLASYVAVLPKLRAELVRVQREAAKNHSVVLEGRDAGTVVFPDADVKFYLLASSEERAKRRLQDLKAENPGVTLEEVQREIEARDFRDETREIAPQVAAVDAVLVDTTSMSIEEVVEHLSAVVRERKTN